MILLKETRPFGFVPEGLLLEIATVPTRSLPAG